MINEKKLGQEITTSTNTETLFTATKKIVVKSIRICNTTAGDVTFRLHNVTNTETSSANNAIYFDTNLPANHTIGDDVYMVLDTGDFITIQSSVAGAITFTVYGAELEWLN